MLFDTVPHQILLVKITLLKKGNKTQAVHNRPVLLTPITCKTLEHILCQHIDVLKLTDFWLFLLSSSAIRVWLTDRTNRVCLDGDMSDKTAVRSGVPQGTVIGTLCLLLYINDIGESTSPVL